MAKNLKVYIGFNLDNAGLRAGVNTAAQNIKNGINGAVQSAGDAIRNKITVSVKQAGDSIRVGIKIPLDQAAGAAQKTGDAVGRIGQQAQSAGRAVKSNITDQFQKAHDIAQRINSTLGVMRNLAALGFGGLAAGVTLAARNGIRMGAVFEDARFSFRALLKDAEVANRLTRDLTLFAARTPFQLTDVLAGGGTALSFLAGQGTPEWRAAEVQRLLAGLGGVTAGLKPAGGIDQALRAYFEVRSGRWDSVQLTPLGVNRDVARGLGIKFDSNGSLAMAGKEAAELLLRHFEREFGELINDNSRLSVILSNFRDMMDRIWGSVGDSASSGVKDFVKGITDRLSELVDNPRVRAALDKGIKSLLDALKPLAEKGFKWLDDLIARIEADPDIVVRFFNGITGALKTLLAVTVALAGAQLLVGLLTAISGLLRAGPVGWLAGAGLIGAVIALRGKLDELLPSLDAVNTSLGDTPALTDGVTGALDGFISKSDDAKVAARDFADQLDRINLANKLAAELNGGQAKDPNAPGFFQWLPQAIKEGRGNQRERAAYYNLGKDYFYKNRDSFIAAGVDMTKVDDNYLVNLGYLLTTGAEEKEAKKEQLNWNRGAGFVSPLEGKHNILTSGFGAKRPGGYHGGIDIGAPAGTRAQAYSDMEVLRIINAGSGNGGGKMVFMEDDNGKVVAYVHLKNLRPNTKVGETISKGSVIGEVFKDHLDMKFMTREVYDQYAAGKIRAPWRDLRTFDPLATGYIGTLDGKTKKIKWGGGGPGPTDADGFVADDAPAINEELDKAIANYAKVKLEHAAKANMPMGAESSKALAEQFDKDLAAAYLAVVMANGGRAPSGFSAGRAAWDRVFGPTAEERAAAALGEEIVPVSKDDEAYLKAVQARMKEQLDQRLDLLRQEAEAYRGQQSAVKASIDALRDHAKALLDLRSRLTEVTDNLAVSLQKLMGFDRGADVTRANQLARKLRAAKAQYDADPSESNLAALAEAGNAMAEFGSGFRQEARPGERLTQRQQQMNEVADFALRVLNETGVSNPEFLARLEAAQQTVQQKIDTTNTLLTGQTTLLARIEAHLATLAGREAMAKNGGFATMGAGAAAQGAWRAAYSQATGGSMIAAGSGSDYYTSGQVPQVGQDPSLIDSYDQPSPESCPGGT